MEKVIHDYSAIPYLRLKDTPEMQRNREAMKARLNYKFHQKFGSRAKDLEAQILALGRQKW